MNKKTSVLIHHAYLLIIIMMGTFFNAGCSNNIQEISNEVSSFEVGQVKSTHSTFDSGNELGHWNVIAYNNNFTMKTCLKDQAIDGAPVKNEKFKIITPHHEVISFTDLEGCLTFSDTVPFNFLANEKFFSYPVIFLGLSNFHGKVTRQLAINPWLVNSDIIQDLKYIGSTKVSGQQLSTSTYTKEGRTQNRNFKVKNINLFLKKISLDAKRKTEVLNYHFSMTPTIIRNSIDGTERELPVSKGKVQVKFTLFEMPAGSEDYKVITTSKNDFFIEDNNLSGPIKLLLKKNNNIQADSLFKIVISIHPLDAPFNLGNEHVLTYMDNLHINKKLKIKRIENIADHFKMTMGQDEVSIQGDEDNEDSEKSEEEDNLLGKSLQDGFGTLENDDFGYMVSQVTIKRGSIISDNYNKGSQKKLRALINICLVDPRSENNDRPITYRSFTIRNSLNKKSLIRKTSSNGCLETFVSVNYDKFNCEHLKNFKLSIIAMDGSFIDIKKDIPLAINPWAKDGPFGYDIDREGRPEDIRCRPPQISIPKISYSNEGNVLSSYRLNDYLHLSFKKGFQFDFNLFSERFHSFSEETVPEAITIGDYQVIFMLLHPKKGIEVNYDNIDLNDFQLFSAAKKKLKVTSNGSISTIVKFPLMFTDSYLLSYKNIVAVRISSKDPRSKLRPTTIVAPFFGIGSGNQLSTKTIDIAQLSKEDRKNRNTLLKDGNKLLKVNKALSERPIQIYKEEFLKRAKKINPKSNVYFANIDELNQSFKKGGEWVRGLKDPIEKIKYTNLLIDKLTSPDMEILSSNSSSIPKKTLSKLCRHFFHVPAHRTKRSFETFEDLGAKKVYLIENSYFMKCIKNPEDYLETVPLTHITKVIPSEVKRNGKVIKRKWATLIGQGKDKVYAGDAYFAAEGNRFFKSRGKRTTEFKHMGGEFSPTIPYLAGASFGIVKEWATYNGYDEGEMQMDYDRYFTQKTSLDLSFNSITLKFKAKVRKCVAVTSKKTSSTHIHLCKKQDELVPDLKESWYFIGRTDMRENSVLSDGNLEFFATETQLIRGTYNYNKAWDKFKNKNAIMLINEIGTAELSSSFQNVLKKNSNEVPDASLKENSFPGLIIPAL